MEKLQEIYERVVAGVATKTETEQLKSWMAVPANAVAALSLIEQSYVNADASRDMPEEISRSVFQAILSADQPEVTSTVKRIPILRRWWVAASVILLLGAGLLFWFLQNESEKDIVMQPVKQIPPGKQGAILILADGSQMVLDSVGDGLIATENGAKILLKNGQLSYDASEAARNKILYNVMVTPRGRQFNLQLPDGTSVWLNAESEIRYPAAFTDNQRKVEIKGEAYFEVAKDAKRPFLVSVDGFSEVEVLGTSFNINAYANSKNVSTTLLQGSIRVSGGKNAASPVTRVPSVVLKPGQQAKIQRNTNIPAAQIQLVENADLEKIMAWKNGLFNFENISLEEAMKQLERWYDIEVVYEKGIPDIKFGGEMSRDVSLEGLLKLLSGSQLHFRMENNRKLIILP